MTARAPDAPSAPDDRFCDLVMKGGITSGVVYPPAICALAKEYRFKNIGGTSTYQRLWYWTTHSGTRAHRYPLS